jgi:RNA polymerase sigma factor (sigma-70 family)
MVLGVCKRVLRNQTDAEDAFQATFVVLALKANSIMPRNNVSHWLHGVAHKTALKAKAMNSKRRIKERQAAAKPMRSDTDDRWALLLEILDSELVALPEKYRAPIILCDLRGLSYREAAAQLGCPQGTLSGRLTRARVLLARRMARRGLPFAAGALATLLARTASAYVSGSLISCTMRAATVLAAGNMRMAGALATNVPPLVEGVMKMLLLSKLKAVAGMVLFVGMAIAAGWLCTTHVYARTILPGEAAVPQANAETQPQVPRNGPAVRPGDAPEAQFAFRGADKSRKVVSLVVAGTSAPLLNLPMTDDLRVYAGARRVGINSLQSGARVSIRLDSTNSAIQEMRTLAASRRVAILTLAADVQDLKSPPTEQEVLRAMRPAARNVPYVFEEYRDVTGNARCTTTKLGFRATRFHSRASVRALKSSTSTMTVLFRPNETDAL